MFLSYRIADRAYQWEIAFEKEMLIFAVTAPFSRKVQLVEVVRSTELVEPGGAVEQVVTCLRTQPVRRTSARAAIRTRKHATGIIRRKAEGTWRPGFRVPSATVVAP